LVNYAMVVSVTQAAQCLVDPVSHHADRPVRALLAGERPQRAADQQVVHGEQKVALLAEVVQAQEVGVLEHVEQLGDAQQLGAEVGLRRQLGADDADRPQEPRRVHVLRPKQLAEPIAAQLLDEAKAGEHETGL